MNGKARYGVVATVALLLAALQGQPAQGDPSAAEGLTPGETTSKPPPPKCADLDCADPMFTVFHPPRGSHVTSHGAEVPSPLAVYDADSAELYGSVDLYAARAVTAGSGYEPVVTDDGRGIALLLVFDAHDSNLGPFRLIELDLLVNERSVTVPTRNPYAFVSQFLNPEHKVWMHKSIRNELMPIDYVREVHGWDEDPAPQEIDVHTTTDGAMFDAKDPAGNPILSGQVALAADPAMQAHVLSQFIAAGSEWVKTFLTSGGLVQLDFVNPDVMRRGEGLMKSHLHIRLKSGPVMSLFGPESTLRMNPRSDFGGVVSRTGFRPVVAVRARFRLTLQSGFAPPLLGWQFSARPNEGHL